MLRSSGGPFLRRRRWLILAGEKTFGIDLKRDRFLLGSVHVVVVARPSPDRERKVRREQIVICPDVQFVVHKENDAVCVRPVLFVL
jgi:hypothetical protein